MGRTISNGFGLKKLNNELYIYNKKLWYFSIFLYNSLN
jgi:hypothetical protein